MQKQNQIVSHVSDPFLPTSAKPAPAAIYKFSHKFKQNVRTLKRRSCIT